MKDFNHIQREFNNLSSSGDLFSAIELIEKIKNDGFLNISNFERSWLCYKYCELKVRMGVQHKLELNSIQESIKHIINDEHRIRIKIQCLQRLIDNMEVNASNELYDDIVEDVSKANADMLYFDLKHLNNLSYKLNDLKFRQYQFPSKAENHPKLRQSYFGGIPKGLARLVESGKLNSKPVVVRELNNVYLLSFSRYMFLFDETKKLIGELSNKLENLPFISDIVNMEVTHSLKGTYALMADWFGGDTYGHWVMDWLPRLSFYEGTGIEFTGLVVRKFDKKFQSDSLKFLGYSDLENFSLDNKQLIFFEKLLVSSNCFEDGWTHVCQGGHPTVMKWWENKVSKNVECTTKKKRLFIPRTGTRKLTNIDECYAILADYGFEIFEPSNYSFKEQLSTFNSAEAIVGNHGAALANCLFMKEGNLLEIFSRSCGTEAYSVAADLKGIKYTSFCPGPHSGLIANFDSSVEMDLNFLKNWVMNL